MNSIKYLHKLLRTMDDINSLSYDLSNSQIVVFGATSLPQPDFSIPVHCFYTSISWLFVIYFEVADNSLKFLIERSKAFGIGKEEIIHSHLKRVHDFRTCFQHNLNLESHNDASKMVRCHDWIRLQLSEPSPPFGFWPPAEDDACWQLLLSALLSEAAWFAEILLKTLTEISCDEYKDDILNIWISRISRTLPSHVWDSITILVAQDFGLSFLDHTHLRKRNLERWNKSLQLLRNDCEIEFEARRIVEQTLLADVNIPLPVTGKDIIDKIGLPQGPGIRNALSLAKELYFDKPCNKDDLLRRLKDKLAKK